MVEDLNSELPRTNPASGSGTTTIYSQGRKEGRSHGWEDNKRALFTIYISTCNSIISNDIWHKYHVSSRAVRPVKFETTLKYHEWYLCQISRTNHAIICLLYTTIRKKFVIFTCRYFTAPSQPNCRNFSCSSINMWIVLKFGRQHTKAPLEAALSHTVPAQPMIWLMCEGWPQHRGLRPLLFSKSRVGSFTSHKIQISVCDVRRDLRFFVLIRED